MAQFAILRFQKCKGTAIGGMEAHHERLKDTYASNPDIDRTKSKQNFHVIKPQGRYRHEIDRLIGQAGCRVRKDSIKFVDTILTASPEFFEGKKQSEIQAFFKRATAFMCEKVGRENILSAVVHLDERTPHMHLCFVPLTKDGRLSAKEIIGNKKNLTSWQDNYFSYMAEKYPDIERGESAQLTKRKHIPTQLYKKVVHLNEQSQEILSLVDGIKPYNTKKVKDEIMDKIGNWFTNAENVQTKLNQYSATVNQLERENTEWKSRAKAGEENKFKEQLRVSTLESEVRRLTKYKDSIPPDLQKEIKARNMQKNGYQR